MNLAPAAPGIKLETIFLMKEVCFMTELMFNKRRNTFESCNLRESSKNSLILEVASKSCQ